MKFKHVLAVLASLTLVSACSAQESSVAAAAAQPEWKAGTNYFVIEPAQPSASGTIEVTEVFSYACPHCAHFQPWAEKLKASLPAGVVMDYKPAVFHSSWEPFAKAYYVAKAMGVLDETHQALFDALHRDHRPIRSLQDLAQFYAAYGVKPQDFLSTAESFMVQTAMTRGIDWERACGVDATPTIIVNGKYRVTAESAGGDERLVQLVDWLARKELAAQHAKAGA